MSILSSIRVASALIHTPYATGTPSRKAWNFVKSKIKNDGYLDDGKTLAIDFAVRRFVEETTSDAQFTFLSDIEWLIPLPRRAPFPSKPTQKPPLWPSHRIAEALLANGVGREIEPCLERTARQDKRNPQFHFDTIEVVGSKLPPKTVLLIDDVVTSGATELGAASRFHMSYPQTEIHTFSLARTESRRELTDFKEMLSPTIELISNTAGGQMASRGPLP